MMLKNLFSQYKFFLSKGYTRKELFIKFFVYKILSSLRRVLFLDFNTFGDRSIVDFRAQVDGSSKINIGCDVFVQKNAWLVVPLFEIKNLKDDPYIVIGDGVRIGANCTISSAYSIVIEDDVLLGPNVMVLDHIHEYANDKTKPISKQGIRVKGSITIKKGAWIGTNVVIVPKNSNLIIGENSIIGANSFVNFSVPNNCIVAGNPATVIDSLC